MEGETLHLLLHVQPKGGRNEVMGEHGGRLKVRVNAPPVEGAANSRLLKFLAGEFGVPRSRVMLQSGGQSREKRVVVLSPKRHPPWLPGLGSSGG